MKKTTAEHAKALPDAVMEFAYKPVHLPTVREQITNLIGNQAVCAAQAIIDQGKDGNVAAVKYLFETIGLFPAPGGSDVPEEEESLAGTLLRRLGLLEPS